uniref:ABM domain-containing protein n=1 Tax=Lotharella globosa TaxID=91324 RepID=A0A7S3YS33_9EUKA|mmetsp:Transcript_487/g.877  ORF Transcript_487/g.877 Transcript_487/m.877 type:complete len:253 (-) Transcript_487:152-910(-)
MRIILSPERLGIDDFTFKSNSKEYKGTSEDGKLKILDKHTVEEALNLLGDAYETLPPSRSSPEGREGRYGTCLFVNGILLRPDLPLGPSVLAAEKGKEKYEKWVEKETDGITEDAKAKAVREAVTSTEGLIAGDGKITPSETTEEFVLIVNMTFSSTGDRAKFLSNFKPLAEFCLKSEPHTLSYKIFNDKDDPLKLTLFERYVNEAGLRVHGTSPMFKKLIRPGGEVLKGLAKAPTKTYQKLLATDIGFMSK